MPGASDIQNWMVELLRRPTDLTRAASDAARIEQQIAGSERLSPAERVEIYRVQFWLRHTACLVEDYPGLGGVLGQEQWERLVESYLAAHAPDSWTLRNLGNRLPAHVVASTWLEHHQLCIDMARLEWAYIELFDAAEAPALDPAKLACLGEDDWQHARIVLNPALRLLRVSYPVAELRRALRAQAGQPVPIPEPGPQCLVLYRAADRSLYDKSVNLAAFELLTLLGAGTPLVAACEQAAARCPEQAPNLIEHVGQWFADFGRRGWVVDVEPAR